MGGYNGGLSVLGVGIKKPSKGGRIKQVNFGGFPFSNAEVLAPQWATYGLFEVLDGGSYSTAFQVQFRGGVAADIIKRVKPNEKFLVSLTADGTTMITFEYDISPSTGKNFYAGASTKYGGGFYNQVTAAETFPQFGYPNDANAVDPSTSYNNYGCAGGGRLAEPLNQLASTSQNSWVARSAGQSPPGSGTTTHNKGVGAAAITFSDSRATLVSLLNGHYKDNWGVDWQDIPEGIWVSDK